MAANDFSTEVLQNSEDKCLCVLLLDTSGSMYGAPIGELNKGLKQFQEQILGDDTASARLEVAIITFGGKVTQIQPPSMLTGFEMPRLIANGATPMMEAIEQAIQLVGDRKRWYKEQGAGYYRPWIVMMTDGEPDDISEVGGMASRLKQLTDHKEFVFTAIGIGDDVNMEVLKTLSPAQPPVLLKGLNFAGFFLWLSNSLTAITEQSADGDVKIATAPIDDWAEFTF